MSKIFGKQYEMVHFWKSYKVVKFEQEQTKSLNNPKTIKDIKLKWNAKSSTSGQIIFRLFFLHIYIFSYTCSVPFPYLSPNYLLKLVNSLIAYAVLRGISMVIVFFLIYAIDMKFSATLDLYQCSANYLQLNL